MTHVALALALLIGQACVAEVSLTDNTKECRQMWGTLWEKPGDLEWRVKNYNTLFKLQRQHRVPDDKRWILLLTADLKEPEHWPAKYGRWDGSGHQKRWAAILKAAERFVKRPRGPLCAADHYGGPVDGLHADDETPDCWKRVCDKQGFQQAYYTVPLKCVGKTISASLAAKR